MEPVPQPAALVLQDCLAEYREGAAKARTRLANSPTIWQMLGAARLEELFELPAEWLAGAPVLEDWSALCTCVILSSRQYHADVLTARMVWRLAGAAHGLPFALAVMLDAVQASGQIALSHDTLLDYGGLSELRARCAAADADTYARILGIAEVQAPRSGLLASFCAYLLPDEAQLLELALARLGEDVPSHGARPRFLTGCRMTQAQLARLLHGFGRTWSVFEAARELLLTMVRIGLPASATLPLALKRARQDHYQEQRRGYFEIARAHDSVDALAALFADFADKDARLLLDPFAHAWPRLAIRLAVWQLLESGDAKLREWLERFAAAHRAALSAALASSSESTRPLLETIAGRLGAERVEAAETDLPDWLRAPPWRARKRAAVAAYPKLVAHEVVPHFQWQDGERARWQGTHSPATMRVNARFGELHGLDGDALTAATLRLFGVPDALHATALAGERLPAGSIGSKRTPASGVLMLLPPLAARAVLWTWGAEPWYHMEGSQLEQVVAWLDGLAARVVEDFPGQSLERGLQLAQPLASARVAAVAANALRTSKRSKALAQSWLLRHAAVAADALLPLLAERKGGDDAAFALRWLLANGREEVVAAAAESYGADGRAALFALRAFDPLDLAPARLPKLPPFWLPAGFARPLLRDGRALPQAVLDAIGDMLAFSPLEPRYAGLEYLRELCTPDSLGAFAWDLFQSWLTAGAPAREAWAFAALAHLGDDECARRLAKLIRGWPTEGNSGRAANGLDVLAAMESDVALMLLHGIAQKVKSKPLQEKARAKMEQLALVRGLSAEELADRLVPDLGLDESGSLALDFGPRQFSVGFDEHLKPQVRDATGAVLKDLPAPLKSDDAALAEATVARFKALKKDARTLAGQQLKRLEDAMVQQRRWSALEFRQFFVLHPLLRHLVRRLLWARRDGPQPQCFRVAEDLSYADAHDALYLLPDEAQVGIVHPLELSPADAAAFGQVFADYEILQPFAQLGRETWRLSEDEQQSFELARFAGRKVVTASLFGLDARGWQREDSGDGGWVNTYVRPLGRAFEAQLVFAPGHIIGDPKSQPEQALESLSLRRPGSWDDSARRRWGELPAVLASEVLRDIDRLAQRS